MYSTESAGVRHIVQHYVYSTREGVQSWRLAKLSYEYYIFNGPITACGMLVRMDFGHAVVPCAVCVRGLPAGELTLWGLWILTRTPVAYGYSHAHNHMVMWLCACVRVVI